MTHSGPFSRFLLLTASLAVVFGCEPQQGRGRPAPGDPAIMDAAVPGATDAAGEARFDDASAATPDVAVAACPEAPARRPGASNPVEVQVELTLDGKPALFGEPNARASGGTVTPSNLRLYVSDVALTGAAGATAVDLATADGAAAPYNVALVNAESDAGMTIRLMAPAGQYTGLSFLFGLGGACNGGDPAMRKPPLTHTSQMTWPHAAGYLFLRYEEQERREAMIHMGGQIGKETAPRMRVPGSFVVVDGQPTKLKLRLALDQLAAGAAMEADLDGYIGIPSPEVIAGERLRQNAPKLPIFTLAP